MDRCGLLFALRCAPFLDWRFQNPLVCLKDPPPRSDLTTNTVFYVSSLLHFSVTLSSYFLPGHISPHTVSQSHRYHQFPLLLFSAFLFYFQADPFVALQRLECSTVRSAASQHCKWCSRPCCRRREPKTPFFYISPAGTKNMQPTVLSPVGTKNTFYYISLVGTKNTFPGAGSTPGHQKHHSSR